MLSSHNHVREGTHYFYNNEIVKLTKASDDFVIIAPSGRVEQVLARETFEAGATIIPKFGDGRYKVGFVTTNSSIRLSSTTPPAMDRIPSQSEYWALDMELAVARGCMVKWPDNWRDAFDKNTDVPGGDVEELTEMLANREHCMRRIVTALQAFDMTELTSACNDALELLDGHGPH